MAVHDRQLQDTELDIEFQDELPPETKMPRLSHGFWEPVLQALQDNPGKWALVHRSINAGTIQWLRNGGYGNVIKDQSLYEFSTRKVRSPIDSKRSVLYMRYMGDA